ncbi:MAG: NYN domain-containing protein [Lachnospiraceae bacterium]|nr:NYN domain-containing protein [Lachnospiraceae bacterium]
MEQTERRFAVLIDADNVSPKYIKYIMDEVSDMGIATYKRIYGDWTDTTKRGWKDVMLEWSINPIQQYSYTFGKNATDSAMIIDAMDILYSGNVEGFCLVSSDSDFTKLAQRLREDGMFVLGMGEKKTPTPFVKACDTFKILEVIASEEISKEQITSLEDIEGAVGKIITENNNLGKPTGIAEVGSVLAKKFSDFDVRNFGYSKLSTFLESLKDYEVNKKGTAYFISDVKTGVTRKELEDLITRQIQENSGKIDNMSQIYEELKRVHPNFNIKQYGYSRFSSFLRSFSRFRIEENVVRLK